MTMISEPQWVGIDVSQAKLDIVVRPASSTWQVPNPDSGWQGLLSQLPSAVISLVVVESTGGMERGVVQVLQQADIPVAVINPKRARDFSKASGCLAKTDRIDAEMLAHFGEALRPLPTPLVSDRQQALSDLIHHRQQLVGMLNDERRRRHSARHRTAQADIDSHLEWLKQRLQALDTEIDQVRQADADWQPRYQWLTSVPGVGRVVATTLLALLPELGRLPSKQLASLVGVAPFNFDSGKLKGKRHIVGGRALVRSALYMAALVAVQHNPDITAFYERLLERVKVKKVALIACAHKLLGILNALVKHQQCWQNPLATSPSSSH